MKTKNILNEIVKDLKYPPGYSGWGFQMITFSRRASNGFHWPEVGVETNIYPLRENGTGGVLLGETWEEISKDVRPSLNPKLLIAAYGTEESERKDDVVRTPQAAVVSILDFIQVLRDQGRGADLRGIQLPSAWLANIDFSGADLREANLRNAQCAFANFDGADLRGADLGWTNFDGVTLRGADLRGARIDYVDWGDADLSEAIQEEK